MRQQVRRIAAIRVVEICILSKFIIEFIRFGPSSTPSDPTCERQRKIMQNYSNIEKSGKFNSFEYKKAREKKNWIERHFWNSFLQTEKNKKRRKKITFVETTTMKIDGEYLFVCVSSMSAQSSGTNISKNSTQIYSLVQFLIDLSHGDNAFQHSVWINVWSEIYSCNIVTQHGQKLI